MTSTTILERFGDMTVGRFMQRHWQRRPALIRAALPGFTPPMDPAELFAMASRDDIESRLVTAFGGRWQLQHGPFARLPARRRRAWTLLVQGVDLHHDAMHRLLQRFRFVPDARLDDLMVSFATDGGGVGPHTDSYDVFLLQAHGARRWRIGPPGDETLQPGRPVKLLQLFAPTQEWVLAPGDMLYLPPGWAHEGVAIGECMTFSIGFRAPSRHEFLSAFLAEAADGLRGPDPRFSDRGRRPTRRAGAVPGDLARQLRRWALDWHASGADVDGFIGRFLTEPKRDVWFERPPRLARGRFVAQACRRGLELDRRTRMAWRGTRVFVNAESTQPTTVAQPWLRRLADRRALSAVQCQQALADAGLADILHGWYTSGWLAIGPPTVRE